MFRSTAVALCCLASPLFAEGIIIEDAYARVSRPGAPTGAIFFTIYNTSVEPDRLVGVASPVAQMVEIHTHIDENGIMKMRPVEDGLAVPAGGTRELKRGGDHVMLMGLAQTLEDGATVPLVLTFERAGELVLDVQVDNDRHQGMDGGQ